jgi:hypothetical protein
MIPERLQMTLNESRIAKLNQDAHKISRQQTVSGIKVNEM